MQNKDKWALGNPSKNPTIFFLGKGGSGGAVLDEYIGFIIPLLATGGAIIKTIVNGEERENEWEIGSIQRLRRCLIEVRRGTVAFLVIFFNSAPQD